MKSFVIIALMATVVIAQSDQCFYDYHLTMGKVKGYIDFSQMLKMKDPTGEKLSKLRDIVMNDIRTVEISCKNNPTIQKKIVIWREKLKEK